MNNTDPVATWDNTTAWEKLTEAFFLSAIGYVFSSELLRPMLQQQGRVVTVKLCSCIAFPHI